MMLIVLIIIKNRTQSVFYNTKELNLYLSKTRTELIIRQGARFTSVSHFLLTLFFKTHSHSGIPRTKGSSKRLKRHYF